VLIQSVFIAARIIKSAAPCYLMQGIAFDNSHRFRDAFYFHEC